MEEESESGICLSAGRVRCWCGATQLPSEYTKFNHVGNNITEDENKNIQCFKWSLE